MRNDLPTLQTFESLPGFHWTPSKRIALEVLKVLNLMMVGALVAAAYMGWLS